MREGKIYPYGVYICDDPTRGRTEIPVALVCEVNVSRNSKEISQLVHCPRCFGFHRHGAEEGFQEGFRGSHCPNAEDRGEIYIPFADHLPVRIIGSSRSIPKSQLRLVK